MKRAVKILIAASAVAAVVGAGTVSFAMWSGGSTSVEVEGTMGIVDVLGSIEVTPSAASGKWDEASNKCVMNNLLSIDQTGDAAGVNFWQFDVKLSGGNSTATVSVTGGFEGSVQANLYITKSEPSASSYSGTDITGSPTFTASTTPTTVYVYMVAYGTNAMNAGIKLTFTASAATS